MAVKTFLEWVYNALKGNLQVDESLYKNYLLEVDNYVSRSKELYVEQLHSLNRKLQDKENKKQEYITSLSRANNDTAISSINNEIESIENSIIDLKGKEDILKRKIEEISVSSKSNIVDYQKFSNFFEKAC